MRILSGQIEFEWDWGNQEKNSVKHNVTSKEAEEPFVNEPFIISLDFKHSTEKETRYQALGKTDLNRKLFISFTIRNDKVRIISVRDMSKKETKTYEEKI